MSVGLLEEAGVSPTLKDFLATSMQGTGFSTNFECDTIQMTASGTVPGTPLADMLYQFGLTKMLRATIQEMREQNLLADVCSNSLKSMSVPVSLADDVALLVACAC